MCIYTIRGDCLLIDVIQESVEVILDNFLFERYAMPKGEHQNILVIRNISS